MSKRGWLFIGVLGLIWGTPYLFIRVAVLELSPPVVVFSRLLLGALVLLPLALRQGQGGVLRTHWKGILTFALIEMVIPFGALGFAEQKLSSSLTGLLVAAVPIVNAVITYQIGLDRNWNTKRISGLLIGLFGVALLVGFEIRAENWWSVAIVAFAVIGYALGPVIISQMLSDVPSSGTIAWSQFFAMLFYLPIVTYQVSNGSWKVVDQVSTNAILSVVSLGLLCTAIAFLVLFKAIDEVGPSRITLITYINPAVAVVLGILILAEPLTAGMILAFPIILIGSILAASKAKIN
jgi:drug/metabolite transporter (DMT)-like permease